MQWPLGMTSDLKCPSLIHAYNPQATAAGKTAQPARFPLDRSQDRVWIPRTDVKSSAQQSGLCL